MAKDANLAFSGMDDDQEAEEILVADPGYYIAQAQWAISTLIQMRAWDEVEDLISKTRQILDGERENDGNQIN